MKKEKNLALIYSAVGHALMHMFAAFYFVIVLAIEKVWLLPYEELLKLWVLGSLLVGDLKTAIPVVGYKIDFCNSKVKVGSIS